MSETRKKEPPKGTPAKAPSTTPNGREPDRAVESPAPVPDALESTLPRKKNPGGKPGRSGPPKGNSNNLRHGLKAGKLPKDAKYIETRLNIFRRNLEDAVMAVKNEITLHDAAAIQTCIRWERHAALAQRWLTKGNRSQF